MYASRKAKQNERYLHLFFSPQSVDVAAFESIVGRSFCIVVSSFDYIVLTFFVALFEFSLIHTRTWGGR